MVFQMFQILYFFIHLIQPILVPVCFCLAWLSVVLGALSIYSAVKDGVDISQKMHRIPCADCQFFTGDYRLKCTVRPTVANTEEAINCIDYQAKTNPMFY